jgi:hypothetical protein
MIKIENHQLSIGISDSFESYIKHIYITQYELEVGDRLNVRDSAGNIHDTIEIISIKTMFCSYKAISINDPSIIYKASPIVYCPTNNNLYKQRIGWFINNKIIWAYLPEDVIN